MRTEGQDEEGTLVEIKKNVLPVSKNLSAEGMGIVPNGKLKENLTVLP
ncbi:hypothetical protein [Thermococcus sp.]